MQMRSEHEALEQARAVWTELLPKLVALNDQSLWVDISSMGAALSPTATGYDPEPPEETPPVWTGQAGD